MAGFSSARAAAHRFGWTVSTYASHENGQTPVPQKAAAKYASKFRVTPGWILTGEGKPPKSMTPKPGEHLESSEVLPADDAADQIITEDDKPFPDALPQMAGRMGAGSTGAVITIDVGEMQSREEVGEWWRIPPAVLRGLARSDVSRTIGFSMEGADSMEPTILRTDIVFIDTGRQKIEPDGIWAIDYGLGRTLKRVTVRKTGTGIKYLLKSDNKSYPDEEYAAEEVTVFGRYVGRFSVF